MLSGARFCFLSLAPAVCHAPLLLVVRFCRRLLPPVVGASCLPRASAVRGAHALSVTGVPSPVVGPAGYLTRAASGLARRAAHTHTHTHSHTRTHILHRQNQIKYYSKRVVITLVGRSWGGLGLGGWSGGAVRTPSPSSLPPPPASLPRACPAPSPYPPHFAPARFADDGGAWSDVARMAARTSTAPCVCGHG